MAVGNHVRSIPDIFVDAVNQFTVLVRKETQIARAEMSEKITDLAIGLGLLVSGAAGPDQDDRTTAARRRNGETSTEERPWHVRASSLNGKPKIPAPNLREH